MKRSEMVKKLAEELSDQETFVKDERSMVALTSLASALLTLCEQNGMKPPKTERCPVLFNEKHVWEKED